MTKGIILLFLSLLLVILPATKAIAEERPLPVFTFGQAVGSFLSIETESFRQFYGSGVFFNKGVDASVRIFRPMDILGLYLNVQFAFFNKSGTSTFGNPLEWKERILNHGVRISVPPLNRLRFWGGIGISWIKVIEEFHSEPVYDDSAFGGYGELGGAFTIIRFIELYMNLKLDSVTLPGDWERFNVGGLSLLIGLKLSI